MSDDEDYMSSTFLTVTEDIRPGLVFSRQTKRKHEIEKKRSQSNEIHKTKSRKQLEQESRNVGLDTAISSDNKGFAMLAKMGYKPGMKLGPPKDDSSNSRGLVEPIRIEVKSGRRGLGSEEEIKRKISLLEEKKSKIKILREEQREQLAKEFQERVRQKISMKHLEADLRKSQKVCQQLDLDNGIEEPMRPWFWYTQDQSDPESDLEEEEEENDEITPDEQLPLILEYLRTKYLYCVWCAIKYDSEEDITENCPGLAKEDHDEL